MLAFGGRQDAQTVQRCIWRLFQGQHQVFQRGVQVIGNARRADGGVHHHGKGKALAQVINVDRQRVVGALFGAQHLDAFGDVDHRLGVRGIAVTVVEDRTEQRRGCGHTAATLGQGQGGVFVVEQFGQAFVGGLHPVAHALLAYVHPQWQGVDEHAQGLVGALAAPHAAEHHAAKYHGFAGGDLAQHLGQCEVHHAGGADTQWSGLGPQATAQIVVDGDPGFIDAMAVTLHILEAERQCGFIDVGEHFAEERFVSLFADAVADLGDVVAKRYRSAGLFGLAGEVQLDLTAHYVEGGVVEDGVVEQQHGDHALIARVFGKHQAQQRCLAEVHAVVARIVESLQLGHCIAIEAGFFADQGGFAPDHLQGFVQAFPGHRGAQDVVAVDDPLKGLGERFKTGAAVEHELGVQHVGVALVG